MSEVKTYITFKTMPESNCGVYNPDWHNLVVLKSDHEAKIAEKDAEIMRLKEKLLNFEGQTFSENQRILELETQNKKLVEALKIANDILGKNSIYYGDLAEFKKFLKDNVYL